jgi:hypothetical protein
MTNGRQIAAMAIIPVRQQHSALNDRCGLFKAGL